MQADFTLELALATTLSILAACSSAEPPLRTAVEARAAFEVAEVVSEGTPGAQTFPSYDASKPDVHVIDVTRYELESAKAKIVEFEYGLMSGDSYSAANPEPPSDHVPCIEFKLVEKDHDAFRAWTAARVGRTMAVLMDRKVVTVAMVNSELPGGGVCDFRASGTTLSEVEALAARLVMSK